MFSIQTLEQLLPHLSLFPQAMLRLPPWIAQTSQALLNLMLSPLKLLHQLPLVLMMPLIKPNPSEDVRYLPVACHPTRSRKVLPHKAISCPLHQLMTL